MLAIVRFLIALTMATSQANAGLNEALSKYLDHNLKVSQMSEAKPVVEKVVKQIMTRIESKDSLFKMNLEYRGSVYEKAKIKEADEFDFDLTITKLTKDEIPSRARLPNDIPIEYTYFTLDGVPNRDEWASLADQYGANLSAERVVQRFSSLVQSAINDMNKEKSSKFLLQFKTNHPAVTIIFKKDGKVMYNVDLAPVIEIKKWPDNMTTGWEKRKRKGWPSEDLINQIKQTSVYLVPKLYKDHSFPQWQFLWRYAFNKAEKKLLLDSDSQVSNNCRRPVLRILKGFISDLDLVGLRSYHMKTILLHEYETWAEPDDWSRENIGERVKKAVRRLQCCITAKNPKLKHYFLPAINIMADINEQQRMQILKKLDLFLKNPQAAVIRLTADAVCTGEGKKSSESCKAYIKLIRDFWLEVKQIAQDDGNSKILALCNDYEKGRFKQLGIHHQL